MVVFTCQKCNSTLKKNAVEKHKSCRPFFLTCIDCLKDFRNNEYEDHKSCITEAQKYGGTNTVCKPQGVKQANWFETAKKVLEKLSQNQKYKKICRILKESSNIPRHRNKFHNFVKSCNPALYNHKEVDEIFDHLEEAKDFNKTENRNDMNERKSILEQDESAPTESSDKKKKKKKKNVSENTSIDLTTPTENGTESSMSVADISENSVKGNESQADDIHAETLEKENKKNKKKKRKNDLDVSSIDFTALTENGTENSISVPDIAKNSVKGNDSQADNINTETLEKENKKNKKKKKKNDLDVSSIDFTALTENGAQNSISVADKAKDSVKGNESLAENINTETREKESKKRSLIETELQTSQDRLDIKKRKKEKKVKVSLDEKDQQNKENEENCQDNENEQNNSLRNEKNNENALSSDAKMDIDMSGLSKKERKKLKKQKKYMAELVEIENFQPEKEEEEVKPEEKVKKKKKKEAEAEATSSVSPKRKHEEENKSDDMKGKKIKLNETLQEEEIPIDPGKKFKWSNVIKQVLENSPNNELSLKKLRKKVMNEYKAQKGDDVPYEKLLGIFNNKINSTVGVKVLKDKAQLSL